MFADYKAITLSSMLIHDCAIISRHAGGRSKTHPSPHPSALGSPLPSDGRGVRGERQWESGERVPVGRVRGAWHVPKLLRGYIACESAIGLVAPVGSSSFRRAQDKILRL